MKSIICIDKDKKKYEVEVNDLVWRPSAYAIIIQDEKILLVPQWDGYDLPGGGIELGENIEEGLIREVKEETGIDVKIGNLIDCKTSFFNIGIKNNKYIQSIMIFYEAEVTGGTLSVVGFDDEEKEFCKEAKWIPLSEIETLNFKSSINTLEVIRKAIK
ncbi:NUDIX domain-containing protein [Candidatus Gracilibacteria bacterium]|nr:NUDIX domain-containing protein [Candidatus Gracilibacteria bacterium]